jgi:hypothetical protein
VTRWWVPTSAAVLGCAALQWLGRTAGSTALERAVPLPGDELVRDPRMVMDHGATVAARPEEVWPWLTQMGWHLGGWYTPHWVDRLLFTANWESLDHLDPALVRDLEVGDEIPDGPPGTAYFRVACVEAPHLLALHSQTHLPPGWAERYGARISWTWTFHLTDLPGAATRIHLRVRGRAGPWWLEALYAATVVPADAVMATGMLRGIRHRVEARPEPRSSGRAPLGERIA